MSYYPIFLDLGGRPCVVVGGGPIGERKVLSLLAAGATVTVVSPTLTEALRRRAAEGSIRHLARAYREGDLAGAQLAFVATEDGVANEAVAREGRARGVWVNAADDPARCDFILPSVLRRGALHVAVATGGACPALSRAIREELEGYFTPDYAALADVVAGVRRELGARGRTVGAAAWAAALDGLLGVVAAGGRGAARARLLADLENARCA